MMGSYIGSSLYMSVKLYRHSLLGSRTVRPGPTVWSVSSYVIQNLNWQGSGLNFEPIGLLNHITLSLLRELTDSTYSDTDDGDNLFNNTDIY